MNGNDYFFAKKILITGATSGLGLDLATKLSELQAAVTITGRNLEVLSLLGDRLKKDNVNFQNAVPADLAQLENIQKLADSVDALDGLVLSAGIIDYTPAKMVSNEKIRRVFQVNFESNVLLIQRLLKGKKISPGASIVFISSIAASIGVPGTSLYAASKAALNSYAKVLASELSLQKIRVNVISPGIVKTELIDRENVSTPEQSSKLEAQYPLGFGNPGDISNTAMFLLSDDSKWITGSNIVIDGGHTLQ